MIIHIENAAKLDKQYNEKSLAKLPDTRSNFHKSILFSTAAATKLYLNTRWHSQQQQKEQIILAKQYATKDALDKANGPVAGWEEIFAKIYMQIYLQNFICLQIKDGSLNLDD